MGIAFPVSKLSPEEYVKMIKAVKAKALSLGKSLIDAKELDVRFLRPKDLGLTTDEWTFNVSAGTNTNAVNASLKDKFLVLIFGIYNLSTNPQVTEVTFKTPQQTIDTIYIEDMYQYDQPAVLLEEPIVYQPGSTVQIDLVAKGANTAEKLGFLGVVVAPKGVLIENAV